MSGSILSWYLDDDEAQRLYRLHPELKASPDEFCPTCDTTKYYFWNGQKHTCNCREQLQLHKHYLRANIGVAYQRLSWEDYAGDPVLKRTTDAYLENHANFVSRGIGLLLHGDVGTGKTMAATLLLKDLVKRRYNCFATTFSSMVEMFTAGWYSPEERSYFESKIVRSDVLLLDDLGKEQRTKTKLSESTFDHVLRQRVQSGRPTLLTTNMTKGELSEGYGKAILSLLREVSIAYEVQGSDYRPQSNQRMMREVQNGEFRPIF